MAKAQGLLPEHAPSHMFASEASEEMNASKARMAAIEARHTSSALRKPEAVPSPAAASGSGRVRRLHHPEEKHEGGESRSTNKLSNQRSAGSGKGPGGRGRGRQQAPIKMEAAMSAAASASSGYSEGMDLDAI